MRLSSPVCAAAFGILLGALLGEPDVLPLAGAQASSVPAAGQPVSLGLPEAIRRAQANEPNFQAALAAEGVASLDRGVARAAILPGVVFHNQALYTQPNGLLNQAGQTGTQPAPVFIANNAVREYASQASITEAVGFRQVAAIRIVDAASARATAELAVARRGLVEATAVLFFTCLAADQRLATLGSARDEAAAFVKLTEQREQARESAHADVLKASLTLQQRTRDVADAELASHRARLELAVLLFADPLTPYSLEPPPPATAMPAFRELEAMARAGSPELASALAALRQSEAQVFAARAAYLPELALNFTYGIDAPEFAKNGPGGAHNLGYSLYATVDLPVWDWLATDHRVKQGELERSATRVALTAAQKRLIVGLRETYDEVRAAESQLASLEQTCITAEESLRLTKLRYASGEATVLEVVDAEATLVSARTTQQDGTLRYEQARSSLETLTGAL